MVRLRALLLSVTVAVLATVTFFRVQAWRSDETLWAAEILSNPTSIRGHLNLGKALDDRADAAGAATEALIVVRLSGDPHLSPWTSAYAWSAGLTNFSRAAIRAGEFAQAQQALDMVLAAQPNFPQAHFHNAILALATHDCARATREFTIAHELEPSLIPWPCHDLPPASPR